MMNIFLTDLTPELRKKLEDANIAFVDMKIDGKKGIIIDGTMTRKALKVLGKKIQHEEPTSLAGIIRVTLIDGPAIEEPEPEPEPEVTEEEIIVDPDGEQVISITDNEDYCKRSSAWKLLCDKLVEFLPLAAKDVRHIAIYLPDNNPEETLDKSFTRGSLHIVIGRQISTCNSSIFGVEGIAYDKERKIICWGKSSLGGDSDISRAVLNILLAVPYALAKNDLEREQLKNSYERVAVRSWNSDGGDRARDRWQIVTGLVLGKFCPARMNLFVPHKEPADPRSSEFNVFIWSSPKQPDENRRMRVPARLWELGEVCTDTGFPSSGTGIDLMADDGYVVGELVNNNLYIHHDACHYGTNQELLIYWRILQEAAAFLALPEKQRFEADRQRMLVQAEHGWDEGKYQRFTAGAVKLLEEKMLPRLGNNRIKLHISQYRRCRPITDSAFHIICCSSPGSSDPKQIKMPRKIWGFSVPEGLYGFTGTSMGIDFRDDNDFLIAELVNGNNLYILIPLFEKGLESGLGIFASLIQEVLDDLLADDETKARKIADRKAKLIEIARRNYAEACNSILQLSIGQLKEKVRDYEQNANQYQKKLIEILREKEIRERQLQGLMEGSAQREQKFRTEFDALWNTPGVENIVTEAATVSIFTEHIYIDEPESGTTFDIGKFRIDIRLDADGGGIKFFNLTRKGAGPRDGFNVQHPHVKFDGTPCLGNITEVVHQLLGDYEILTLAQICLQFLRTVNLEDNSGSMISDYWPTVKKEIKKEAATAA